MSVRFSDYHCMWRKYDLPTWIAISKSSDTTLYFVFACMHTHKHLLAFIIIFQGSKKKEKHRNSSICRFEHPSPKAHVLFSSSLFPMGKTQIRGVAQMSLPRLQIYNLHICGTLDFHCLVYLLGDSSIPGLCRCSSFQT